MWWYGHWFHWFDLNGWLLFLLGCLFAFHWLEFSFWTRASAFRINKLAYIFYSSIYILFRLCIFQKLRVCAVPYLVYFWNVLVYVLECFWKFDYWGWGFKFLVSFHSWSSRMSSRWNLYRHLIRYYILILNTCLLSWEYRRLSHGRWLELARVLSRLTLDI